jgi:hypothetical protein
MAMHHETQKACKIHKKITEALHNSYVLSWACNYTHLQFYVNLQLILISALLGLMLGYSCGAKNLQFTGLFTCQLIS